MKINRIKIQIVLLVVAFAVLCIFLYTRIEFFIDSDIASQLVLSKLLSEEGKILSDNWYYATELRVFSYQLIFTPLFWITSNWHIVRITGSVAHYLLMLSGLYYMCCQMRLRKYFPFLGIIFILPFSETYFAYALRNINYVPFISISFFTIGMMFALVKQEYGRRKNLCLIMLIALLAVCSGMNGLRQAFILYLPLTLAPLLLLLFSRYRTEDRKKILRFAFVSGGALCFSGVGYLVNAFYLSKRYSYSTYESIAWKRFSLNGIVNVLNGWMENLGYVHEEKLFSDAILHNVVCVVMIGITVYAVYHTLFGNLCETVEARIMTGYLVCGLLCSIVLYSLTSMPYIARYDLSVSIFCFPVVMLFLSGASKERLKLHIRNGILIALGIGVMICSMNNYKKGCMIDTTSELKNVLTFLEEQDYKNGYATFWNANVSTELSNGKISVWVWQDGSTDFSNVNTMYPWVQIKDHDHTYPEGKIFWILSKEEKKNFSIAKQAGDTFIIYRTKNYTVYGFDDYESMIFAISHYQMDFYEDEHFSRGKNEGGMRYLYEDGISYGPYITLYSGRYRVSFTGKGLDRAGFDCVFRDKMEEELQWVQPEDVVQSAKSLYYEVEVGEDMNYFEARIYNHTKDEIVISDFQIEKIR